MDSLDIRIIRAMGVQPYGSSPRSTETLRPRHIAKILGVSQETVRDRIAKMEKNGAIAGFSLVPNLDSLGYRASGYYYRFQDESDAPTAFDRIATMDGLIGVYSFAGSNLAVVFTHRSDADRARKLRLLATLAGEGELVLIMDRYPFPKVRRDLGSLDWRIIQALVPAPLASDEEVAKAIGVSGRTVKRRRQRMEREGSYFVIPDIDPASVPGLVLFDLYCLIDSRAGSDVAGRLQRALDSNLVCVEEWPDSTLGNYSIGLYATTMSEIEELRRKAAAVPGVKRAQVLIIQRSVESFDWVLEEVAHRAGSGSKAIRAASR